MLGLLIDVVAQVLKSREGHQMIWLVSFPNAEGRAEVGNGWLTVALSSPCSGGHGLGPEIRNGLSLHFDFVVVVGVGFGAWT